MKGTSIFNLVSRYDLAAGQTYTATRNMNFYFVFEAEQIYTGQFVFTIWFSNVAGSAPLPQPTIPTPENNPEIIKNIGSVVATPTTFQIPTK